MSKGLPDHGTAMPIDELLDHDEVDWQRVRHTRYAIHQHLIYEYPGPIYDLNQRLMILPPHQHGDQRMLDYRLGVSASHYEMICQDDSFGNREIRLGVSHVERVIDFEAWILVERSTEAGLVDRCALIGAIGPDATGCRSAPGRAEAIRSLPTGTSSG